MENNINTQEDRTKVEYLDKNGLDLLWAKTKENTLSLIEIERNRAVAEEEANAAAIATETTNRQSSDAALQNAIDAHKADTSNPHNVTKEQVGLGNVDNTADADKVVASADKLTTSRKIWGQEFDGSADVSGDITLDGNIVTSGDAQLVDLGLPSGTLWMDRNVGASSPEDAGLYFAWGETQGYTADEIGKTKQFNLGDYKFYESSLTKYNSKDSLTTLETTDDAVLQNVHKYSMPTKAQLQELLDETTSTWTTQNGKYGRLFASKSNGNSIFIPAGSSGSYGSMYDFGDIGYLWSSSLYETNVYGAYDFAFDSDQVYLGNINRYEGIPVRGVATPAEVSPAKTYTLPSSSGTLALTSDVEAETARATAKEEELQSAIESKQDSGSYIPYVTLDNGEYILNDAKYTIKYNEKAFNRLYNTGFTIANGDMTASLDLTEGGYIYYGHSDYNVQITDRYIRLHERQHNSTTGTSTEVDTVTLTKDGLTAKNSGSQYCEIHPDGINAVTSTTSVQIHPMSLLLQSGSLQLQYGPTYLACTSGDITYFKISDSGVQTRDNNAKHLFATDGSIYDATNLVTTSDLDAWATSNGYVKKSDLKSLMTAVYKTQSNGVYILDTDDNLVTADDWDTADNDKAVGVAVLTADCQFVIAPNSNSSLLAWGSYGTTVSGLTTAVTNNAAKADFGGSSNTNTIIAQLGTGNAPAAEYCKSYTFKNGKTGYLWSLGEAYKSILNRNAINNALEKIGGSIISSSYTYWASTQYSNNNAWYIYDEKVDEFEKSNKCVCRAVCAL